MPKIQLPVSVVRETIWGDAEETELISTEEIDTSRWANIYVCTFKYQDKFYQFEYRQGTGDSGERPFEYDDEDKPIDCVEVEPYEVTVTKYRPIKD